MQWLSILSKIVLLAFLAIAALTDCKSKKISIVFVACGFAVGLTMQILIGELKFYELLGGCALGAIMLLISKLTNQAIGYGDGLMLIATGAFLGIFENVMLLLIALLIAAVISIVLLVIKKKKKNFMLPFLPFLLSSYVLMLAVY